MKKYLVLFLMAAFSIAAIAGTNVGVRQTKIITYKVGDRTADFNVAYSAAALPIWTIPAKTLIYDVSAFVTTAVTGTVTAMLIGDDSDDNGFLTLGFATATGPHTSGYNSDAYRGTYLTNTATVNTSKYYATADTLDLTMVTDSATAVTAGEFRVMVDFIRLD